jgi:hypothetical protein
MHRVQFLWTVAVATRNFVPSWNAAAPAAPVALPAEQIMQPLELAMLPGPAEYVDSEAAGRGGLSSGAVAAFVGVAAAVSTLLKSKHGRPARALAEPGLTDLEAMNGVFDPLQFAQSQPRVAMLQMGGVESMEGVGPETGNKVFDPLGLATMGSESTLRFFRHAELKHGRVAMAAMVGFLVHINHIHFPGMLSPTYGVSFESLSAMGPFEAWNNVPLLGQIQILWTIAGLEHASECLDPKGHYTKGGTPGDLKFLKNFWDTPGFTKKLTPEQLAKKRMAELRNGRLAMIGIMSVCASMNIPGSVPFLKDAPALIGPGFALPFGTF